jgi:hypothetical protein
MKTCYWLKFTGGSEESLEIISSEASTLLEHRCGLCIITFRERKRAVQQYCWVALIFGQEDGKSEVMECGETSMGCSNGSINSRKVAGVGR